MASSAIEEFMIAVGFEEKDGSIDGVKSTADGLKSYLTKALGTIGIALSITGISQFIQQAVEAGSEAEQVTNRFEVLFGDSAEASGDWAKELADNIGRSVNDIKSYLNESKAVVDTLIEDEEAAADLSEQMVETAINIASFNDISDESAITAMANAIKGTTSSAEALGVTLDDTTLALAMTELGLSGTFDALDSATQAQARYQAIVMQSSDALREENGVIGDAAISMDTMESKITYMQSLISDITAYVGTYILPYAKQILDFLNAGLRSIRDFTEKLNDLNDSTSFAAKLSQTLTDLLNRLGNLIKSIANFASNLTDRLGGVDNVLEIVTGTLAVLLGMSFISKIAKMASGFKSVTDVVSKLHLKLVAIIAIAVAIFLIIDDIVNFCKGNNSVIGELISANGGDADELRETILGAVEGVSEALSYVTEAFDDLGQSISSFWSENGETIQEGLYTAFSILIGVVVGLANAIGPLITLIVDLGAAILNLFKGMVTGDASDFVESCIDIWEDFVDTVTGFVDGLTQTLNQMLGTDLPEDMKQWATDAVDNFIQGIGDFAGKVKQTLSDGVNWIANNLGHSTPKEGPLAGDDEWGSDFVENFVTGINSGTGLLESAVSGAADTLNSIMDTIDISDWGTDLADSVIGSINAIVDAANSANLEGFKETLEGIGSTILGGDLGIGLEKATTAASANPYVSNYATTSSIVQNISYTNTFNGDLRTTQQIAADKMEQSAKDTTTYLADALAYGR